MSIMRTSIIRYVDACRVYLQIKGLTTIQIGRLKPNALKALTKVSRQQAVGRIMIDDPDWGRLSNSRFNRNVEDAIKKSHYVITDQGLMRILISEKGAAGIVGEAENAKNLILRSIQNKEIEFWAAYNKINSILLETDDYQKMAEAALKKLELKSGDLLVDAGCGSGNFGVCLRKHGVENITPVSFDISSASVIEARRNEGSAKQDEADEPSLYLCSDMAALALKDECADKAVSILVLGYLLDRPKALSEIKRILKPGGHLVITTPIKGAHFLTTYFRGLFYSISHHNPLYVLKRLNRATKALIFGLKLEKKSRKTYETLGLAEENSRRISYLREEIRMLKNDYLPKIGQTKTLDQIKQRLKDLEDMANIIEKRSCYIFLSEDQLKQDLERAGFVNVQTFRTFGGLAAGAVAQKP